MLGKRKTLIILAGILTSVACCYLGWFSEQPVPPSDHIIGTYDTVLPLKTQGADSVLRPGEDKEKVIR